MNVTNAIPPGVAASAASPGTAGTATTTTNGGIADLFAALLASLQASLSTPSAAGVAPAHEVETESTAFPVCDECSESETLDEDDLGAETANTSPQIGAAGIVAEATNPAAAATSAITTQEIVARDVVVVPVVKGPVSPARPTPVVTAAATADADAIPLATAAPEETVSSVPKLASSSVTPENTNAKPSGAPFGSVVVEAVRLGQAQASESDAAPGRTIRELVRDATQLIRQQTQAASASAPPETPAQPDSAYVAAATRTVAEVKPDPLGELRPVLADSASKVSPQIAVAAVAPGGGETAAPDATTTQLRAGDRAVLPQSVDVRDVGDVTVRSVRYLSGRTEETVTVRLVPRSLGELQIAVRTSADGLDVVLTAAGHAARDRLEGQIMGLRDLLAREGLDVKSVTVQAAPTFDLSGQMPSHQHQHQQSQGGQAQRFHAQAFRDPEPNPSEQPEKASGRPQHDGGLNMLA